MKPTFKLTPQTEQIINEIIERGNSVEIRRRKDGIVIMEISGKLKQTIPFNHK